ncbi:5'-AMP-activated protein kinase beta subunit, interation domain-containing protein [Powellomyces hirtus]|nr:5'-AMP-activated protein kinase beta subunit, interation domain-containing protein [Powellomyces hirtus]
MISWAQGGGAVYVTGTFNNWKQKIRMSRSNADFTTVIDMPPGTHRFKFIVDDEWKCSEDLPIASDADGNLVNYLEVTDEAGERQGDGLDELAKYGDGQVSPTLLSSTPPEAYTTDIPTAIIPPASSSSSHQQQQQQHQQQTPPHLPPHLEKVLLNSHALSKDDRSVLPVPNHVTLNHMYACSIRDGVMAVGCTTRYRMKVCLLTGMPGHDS